VSAEAELEEGELAEAAEEGAEEATAEEEEG